MEANETKQAFDKVMSGEIVNTQNYTLCYDLCTILGLLKLKFNCLTRALHMPDKKIYTYSIYLEGGEQSEVSIHSIRPLE